MARAPAARPSPCLGHTCPPERKAGSVVPESNAEVRAQVRSAIGRVGVWSFSLERHPVGAEREAVAEIEALGYPVVWIPEGWGSKDALTHAALILPGGSRIIVATGIASMWARDPVAMANGARLIEEAFPGRFLLGIGVSHRTSVDRRGSLEYESPYKRMRSYLEAMDGARYPVRDGPPLPPVVLAALGPNMLRLAAERAVGAHPYFVPVEHTVKAREALGDSPILAPEQAVVLESDPDKARTIARAYMEHYIKLDNYANNLRRLGFSETDLAEGGSDRLVDAIVGWGDVEAIRTRVRQHLEAGADHVSVQVLAEDPLRIPLAELRELAPALLAQIRRPGG
jgi:probable F420-dependent oxidoreductase